MVILLLLGFISLVLSSILTPIIRRIVTRLGLLDHPDSVRKIHSHPIPRFGGVAVWGAFLASLSVLFFVPPGFAKLAPAELAPLWKLLPAAGLVFFIGLWDDIRGMRPSQKLTGQVLAGVIAYAAGVRILGIAGYPAGAWLSPVLTVFWLVACMNAFNLIDGLDGLASGIGLFAAATILVASILNGNLALAAVTAALVGSLLGFLRYNFSPASIFLGDSGSLLLGFILATLGVVWSQKSATLIGMTAPVTLLAIPLLDTVLAVARRFLQLRPIFEADRDHIHHRLLARGLTPRHAVLLLYGFCGVAAILSLLQNSLPERSFVILILCFIAMAVGVRRLRYVELSALGRAMTGGNLRQFLGSAVYLRSLEQELVAAKTEDECWEVIRESARHIGFEGITLRVGQRLHNDGGETGVSHQCWNVRVPLADSDYVEFSCRLHRPQAQAAVTGLFVELIHSRLKLGFEKSSPRAPLVQTIPPQAESVFSSRESAPRSKAIGA